MRQVLESEAEDSMEEIQRIVTSSLEGKGLQVATFNMWWNLGEYFDKQMDRGQRFEDMLVTTGKLDRAWASTCKEYMQLTWPRTGLVTLRALQLRLPFGSSCQPAVASDGDFVVRIHNPGVLQYQPKIEVQGTCREITEVAQQLVWLGSVFRYGYSDEICGSSFWYLKSPSRFYFGSDAKRMKEDEYTSFCWTSLFSSGTLAPGFPIPLRAAEVGIEISFDAMLKLACIEYPIYYGQAVAFRGWRTLLYPVSVSPNFERIQWHLIVCDDPADMRLTTSLSAMDDLQNWKTSDIAEIRKARSFLGYCRHAEVSIGTENYRLQKSDQKSGASNEQSRGYWMKKIVLSMGTSGMGAFGAGISGEIGFTKTQVAKMAPHEAFDRVLEHSATTPVLMYDVSKCTGWLVSELCVVLHMARSWFRERKDLADGEIENLPAAILSSDGGQAAYQCIRGSRNLEFRRSLDNDAPWKFMDIIKDSLRILKAARDTKDRAQSSISEPWIISWLRSPRLYGWELADMMQARVFTSRKEVAIKVNKSDKWITYIANHPNVLTLFCNGIDAPISRKGGFRICRTWSSVPSGENLLVSTTQSLKDLANQCDGDIARRRLTNTCYLYYPNKRDPFAPCKYRKHHSQICQRLHQVTTSSQPQRQEGLAEDGAVLIGLPETITTELYQRPISRPNSNAKRPSHNVDCVLPDPQAPLSARSGSSESHSTHPVTPAASSTLISNGESHNPKYDDQSETDLSSTTITYEYLFKRSLNNSSSRPGKTPSISTRSSIDKASTLHTKTLDSECRILVLAFLHSRRTTATTNANLDTILPDIDQLLIDGKEMYARFRQQEKLLSSIHRQMDSWWKDERGGGRMGALSDENAGQDEDEDEESGDSDSDAESSGAGSDDTPEN